MAAIIATCLAFASHGMLTRCFHVLYIMYGSIQMQRWTGTSFKHVFQAWTIEADMMLVILLLCSGGIRCPQQWARMPWKCCLLLTVLEQFRPSTDLRARPALSTAPGAFGLRSEADPAGAPPVRLTRQTCSYRQSTGAKQVGSLVQCKRKASLAFCRQKTALSPRFFAKS